MTTTTERNDQIQDALARIWGFETLRPLQKEVVDAALNNRDAVVVMPTGGGKSLCFQLPAIVDKRLTVVISPLIALMKDQVDALTVVGVPAAALNSSQTEEEERETHRRLAKGEIRLLYVSPERLLLNSTLRLLSQADNGNGVARFAIDEAHCISAWGHDFRPEFRQLNRIKEVFPGTPVQAFTATATPQVQRDIAIQLKLERPRRFVGIFDRPNLTYRVVAKDDPVRRTVEAVRRYPGEGVIVYCLSRKDTESITNALVAQGIPAVAYHAGLPPETRKKVSEEFAQEKANIVVATIAFGMGIDRSNVRCVIHECLPKSMEGYQQETGRAGRDGLPSECVLLYSHADVVRLKRLLSDGEPEVVAHHSKLLEEVRRFVTSHQCRHKALSEYFGQDYSLEEDGCGACDVCLGGMEPLQDSSKIGHQILSAARDLLGSGRSFGVAHLVAVLTGSRAKSVLERGGDQVKGFSAFGGQSPERVTLWVHQLMDLGLLDVTAGQYPVVIMTDLGSQVSDNLSPIRLIENVALLAPASDKKAKSSVIPIKNMDSVLFEKLRDWRRSVAVEKGVPAYVIFHDATLMKISAARPSQLSRLRSISGVGDRRADEFGAGLISLIADYCAESGAAQDQSIDQPASPKTAPTVTTKTSAYFSFFRVGVPVDRIAADTKVSPRTVWQHLATWVELERPPSIRPWIDESTESLVIDSIGKVGGELLKPIFEHLDGTVPYEEIRVIRAFSTLSES